MRRPDPRAARNTATLVVLLGGCAVMAAVPFLSMKTTENLMNRDKALTGTQGAYVAQRRSPSPHPTVQ